ncbi:hypothetical protein J6590_046675 [Homalodisca vitripennis]|nr:hypothetical protein J6590_046675 [Homalodisca vitripennis]
MLGANECEQRKAKTTLLHYTTDQSCPKTTSRVCHHFTTKFTTLDEKTLPHITRILLYQYTRLKRCPRAVGGFKQPFHISSDRRRLAPT